MENTEKISFKNSDLSTEAINSINNLLNVDINASAAFKLSRIIKEISSIAEDKKTTENKIIDKWAERDDNGEVKKPLDDKGNPIKDSILIKDPEAFNKEMEELLSVENHLQYDKIKFEDLGLGVAKIKDLMIIDFLFY